MAVHPSTALLKAELATPSVTGRTPVSDAIKAQRASLLTAVAQADAYTALIVDAIEDETNDKVAGKYESLHQTMVAIRRIVARLDEQQHKLSTALRNFETERADVIAIITREE